MYAAITFLASRFFLSKLRSLVVYNLFYGFCLLKWLCTMVLIILSNIFGQMLKNNEFKNNLGEAVLRWHSNRTGRPLSPPQIHQKIIWMLSNFHKTTSEHWQRIPGTQKGSPFSSKGSRTKYKRQKERQKS